MESLAKGKISGVYPAVRQSDRIFTDPDIPDPGHLFFRDFFCFSCKTGFYRVFLSFSRTADHDHDHDYKKHGQQYSSCSAKTPGHF